MRTLETTRIQLVRIPSNVDRSTRLRVSQEPVRCTHCQRRLILHLTLYKRNSIIVLTDYALHSKPRIGSVSQDISSQKSSYVSVRLIFCSLLILYRLQKLLSVFSFIRLIIRGSLTFLKRFRDHNNL